MSDAVACYGGRADEHSFDFGPRYHGSLRKNIEPSGPLPPIN